MNKCNTQTIKGVKLMRVQCPCCGYFTFDSKDDAFFEICEVCFWQYDEVAHDKHTRIFGANKVSLDQAKKNYKEFGACETRFINSVREPYEYEYPENNSPLNQQRIALPNIEEEEIQEQRHYHDVWNWESENGSWIIAMQKAGLTREMIENVFTNRDQITGLHPGDVAAVWWEFKSKNDLSRD